MTGTYNNIRGAETHKYIVPVGGSVDVGASGEFVRCLSATDDFGLSINGGARMYFSANLQFRCAGTEQYNSFTLHNTGNTTLEVLIAYGFGEVTDDRIGISGTVTTSDTGTQAAIGALATQNGNDANDLKNKVDAVSAAVGNAEGKIDALIALMQNDVALRKPVTTLENCSYAGITNASTEIVSAAANVNGIIIRAATIATSGNTATLSSDGEVVSRVMGASGTAQALFIENIFIPAGRNLLANTGSTSSVYIWYEVL